MNLKSRKFIILIVGFVGLFVMMGLDKITVEQFMEIAKYLVPAYFVGNGLEHIGKGRSPTDRRP